MPVISILGRLRQMTVTGWPGPHTVFKASWDYIARPVSKTKQQQQKKI